ncbi:hypothetical protein HUG10_20990 (plasmid) [Halorarum halophilum]|uniref:Uncharacterized protein n=1 Tax=Halorarum halophilum TaxID=2743090 RepID=A0A7D5GPW1_9EURY|nr:hypothetical protein [Halobaculum halophilum]QLG30064.1 hypothetical protein HUG10_20990 [Halobaculum halophilum]
MTPLAAAMAGCLLLASPIVFIGCLANGNVVGALCILALWAGFFGGS